MGVMGHVLGNSYIVHNSGQGQIIFQTMMVKVGVTDPLSMPFWSDIRENDKLGLINCRLNTVNYCSNKTSTMVPTPPAILVMVIRIFKHYTWELPQLYNFELVNVVPNDRTIRFVTNHSDPYNKSYIKAHNNWDRATLYNFRYSGIHTMQSDATLGFNTKNGINFSYIKTHINWQRAIMQDFELRSCGLFGDSNKFRS